MFSRTWNLTSQCKQQHAHTESLFLTARDRNAVHSRLVFPQFFKTAPRKVSFEITSQEERRKNNFQLFSYFSGTFSWNTKARNYIFWEQLFCENNVILSNLLAIFNWQMGNEFESVASKIHYNIQVNLKICSWSLSLGYNSFTLDIWSLYYSWQLQWLAAMLLINSSQGQVTKNTVLFFNSGKTDIKPSSFSFSRYWCF